MSDYLPNELQYVIFKRLPAKFLVRCTAVCKSWYSLITSPDFISYHFNHTLLCNQDDAQTLVLRRSDPRNKNKDNPLVQNDEISLYKFSYLNFPFKINEPFGVIYKTVGSCMGLVCLVKKDYSNIILWNPSIRKFVEIGLTNMPELSHHRVVLGFGFCPTTYYHKIVKIEYPDENTPPKVEIYGFSSRTWKNVPCDLPPCSVVEILWSQALLNGAIHWVVKDKRVAWNKRSIMSFDLVNEAFREFELPEYPSYFDGQRFVDVFLAIYKEYLCVFECTMLHCICRIWIMTEYGVSDSWTPICGFANAIILGLGKNSDVLVKRGSELVLHTSAFEGRGKSLCAVESISSFYADTYMENLLLLNGQSQI